jgi:hypothetical protein
LKEFWYELQVFFPPFMVGWIQMQICLAQKLFVAFAEALLVVINCEQQKYPHVFK